MKWASFIMFSPYLRQPKVWSFFVYIFLVRAGRNGNGTVEALKVIPIKLTKTYEALLHMAAAIIAFRKAGVIYG
jgi:hypothetical protein